MQAIGRWEFCIEYHASPGSSLQDLNQKAYQKGLIKVYDSSERLCGDMSPMGHDVHIHTPSEVSVTMTEMFLERWVARHLGKVRHERRVRDTATALFDLTHRLHGLEHQDRRILRWAALVHDVGRAIDDATHPLEGARLIERHKLMPINVVDRRRLVYLTLYHRGAVPKLGYDDVLRPGDGRRATRLLLGILRTADALDSRQYGDAPELSFSLKINRGKPGRLKIEAELPDDSAKVRRAYDRPKKYRLLEEVLELKVQVELRAASSVEA